MNNNQTLKGFRDFLPQEKRARDFVAAKIKAAFERFGFEPLETPTLEYASLLLGKYGAEADKLVFTFEDKGGRQVGLRYDQTVPTARVLAQYQNELPKYFRRFQIQNVFRADKPQKGRYREFTQCDIDIFGSTSPICDAEIMACTYFAYTNIGFPQVTLKVNDRQVLFDTLKSFVTPAVDIFSIVQSIDKLDKQTQEQVVEELVAKGLSGESANQAINAIRQAQPSPNLIAIFAACENLGVPRDNLHFEPSLARGLDYYTGMIFEVIIPDYPVGSCGGGGRYDNLIQQLGGPQIPAVGIAFGFDRMVEAAIQLQLIPTTKAQAQVLIAIFDDTTMAKSLALAATLRQNGIAAEVYPALDKLGKQFKAADQKGIPFVAIIGPEEAEKNTVTLKNLQTGDQVSLAVDDLVAKLKS